MESNNLNYSKEQNHKLSIQPKQYERTQSPPLDEDYQDEQELPQTKIDEDFDHQTLLQGSNKKPLTSSVHINAFKKSQIQQNVSSSAASNNTNKLSLLYKGQKNQQANFIGSNYGQMNQQNKQEFSQQKIQMLSKVGEQDQVYENSGRKEQQIFQQNLKQNSDQKGYYQYYQSQFVVDNSDEHSSSDSRGNINQEEQMMTEQDLDGHQNQSDLENSSFERYEKLVREQQDQEEEEQQEEDQEDEREEENNEDDQEEEESNEYDNEEDFEREQEDNQGESSSQEENIRNSSMPMPYQKRNNQEREEDIQDEYGDEINNSLSKFKDESSIMRDSNVRSSGSPIVTMKQQQDFKQVQSSFNPDKKEVIVERQEKFIIYKMVPQMSVINTAKQNQLSSQQYSNTQSSQPTPGIQQDKSGFGSKDYRETVEDNEDSFSSQEEEGIQKQKVYIENGKIQTKGEESFIDEEYKIDGEIQGVKNILANQSFTNNINNTSLNSGKPPIINKKGKAKEDQECQSNISRVIAVNRASSLKNNDHSSNSNIQIAIEEQEQQQQRSQAKQKESLHMYTRSSSDRFSKLQKLEKKNINEVLETEGLDGGEFTLNKKNDILLGNMCNNGQQDSFFKLQNIEKVEIQQQDPFQIANIEQQQLQQPFMERRVSDSVVVRNSQLKQQSQFQNMINDKNISEDQIQTNVKDLNEQYLKQQKEQQRNLQKSSTKIQQNKQSQQKQQQKKQNDTEFLKQEYLKLKNQFKQLQKEPQAKKTVPVPQTAQLQKELLSNTKQQTNKQQQVQKQQVKKNNLVIENINNDYNKDESVLSKSDDEQDYNQLNNINNLKAITPSNADKQKFFQRGVIQSQKDSSRAQDNKDKKSQINNQMRLELEQQQQNKERERSKVNNNVKLNLNKDISKLKASSKVSPNRQVAQTHRNNINQHNRVQSKQQKIIKTYDSDDSNKKSAISDLGKGKTKFGGKQLKLQKQNKFVSQPQQQQRQFKKRKQSQHQNRKNESSSENDSDLEHSHTDSSKEECSHHNSNSYDNEDEEDSQNQQSFSSENCPSCQYSPSDQSNSQEDEDDHDSQNLSQSDNESVDKHHNRKRHRNKPYKQIMKNSGGNNCHMHYKAGKGKRKDRTFKIRVNNNNTEQQQFMANQQFLVKLDLTVRECKESSSKKKCVCSGEQFLCIQVYNQVSEIMNYLQYFQSTVSIIEFINIQAKRKLLITCSKQQKSMKALYSSNSSYIICISQNIDCITPLTKFHAASGYLFPYNNNNTEINIRQIKRDLSHKSLHSQPQILNPSFPSQQQQQFSYGTQHQQELTPTRQYRHNNNNQQEYLQVNRSPHSMFRDPQNNAHSQNRYMNDFQKPNFTLSNFNNNNGINGNYLNQLKNRFLQKKQNEEDEEDDYSNSRNQIYSNNSQNYIERGENEYRQNNNMKNSQFYGDNNNNQISNNIYDKKHLKTNSLLDYQSQGNDNRGFGQLGSGESRFQNQRSTFKYVEQEGESYEDTKYQQRKGKFYQQEEELGEQSHFKYNNRSPEFSNILQEKNSQQHMQAKGGQDNKSKRETASPSDERDSCENESMDEGVKASATRQSALLSPKESQEYKSIWHNQNKNNNHYLGVSQNYRSPQNLQSNKKMTNNYMEEISLLDKDKKMQGDYQDEQDKKGPKAIIIGFEDGDKKNPFANKPVLKGRQEVQIEKKKVQSSNNNGQKLSITNRSKSVRQPMPQVTNALRNQKQQLNNNIIGETANNNQLKSPKNQVIVIDKQFANPIAKKGFGKEETFANKGSPLKKAVQDIKTKNDSVRQSKLDKQITTIGAVNRAAQKDTEIGKIIVNELDTDPSDPAHNKGLLIEIFDKKDVKKGKNKGESEEVSLADMFLQKKKNIAEKLDHTKQKQSQQQDQDHLGFEEDLEKKGKTKQELFELRKKMMKSKLKHKQDNFGGVTSLQEDQLGGVTSGNNKQQSKEPLMLMQRLAKGEKPQIDKKEMKKLTNKNYQNLPEIQKKKEEEKKKGELMARKQAVQEYAKQMEEKRRKQLQFKKKRSLAGEEKD